MSEIMKNHTIRMTDAEWEKCQLMGGAAWIREKIKNDIRRHPLCLNPIPFRLKYLDHT